MSAGIGDNRVRFAGLPLQYEMQRGVKMSWAAARDECADLGKSLPVIKDSATSVAFEADIK